MKKPADQSGPSNTRTGAAHHMAHSSTAPLLDEPQDGVKDVALVPASDAPDPVLMFERLAKDPSVDVEKLQRLIDMQKDILRHNAESAFNVAFSKMQAEIPTIVERARTDKTSYAPLEDIIQPIRPILQRHGFSLSFKTEWPEKGTVKVVGILTHDHGHSRTSEFVALADASGSKNAIQAFGSSVSYGRRYTTRDLLCIVTREEDDDAEQAGRKAPSEAPPDGYEAWLATLEGVASEGMKAFSTAWDKSNPVFRQYLARTAPKQLFAIKAKAGKVKA